jgi:hypothetical protein
LPELTKGLVTQEQIGQMTRLSPEGVADARRSVSQRFERAMAR